MPDIVSQTNATGGLALVTQKIKLVTGCEGGYQVYPGHQAVPPTSRHMLKEWPTLSCPHLLL